MGDTVCLLLTQSHDNPWVIYYRENEEIKHKSIVMLTDNLKHDTTAVATFQPRLIEDIKELKPNIDITKIHFWSDGAASQYKNRIFFSNIYHHKEDFGIKADWSFWATSHGKGPWDGVGGKLKRSCTNAIQQESDIRNPVDVYHHGVKAMPSVKFHWIASEEVDRTRKKLKKRFNKAERIEEGLQYKNILIIIIII